MTTPRPATVVIDVDDLLAVLPGVPVCGRCHGGRTVIVEGGLWRVAPGHTAACALFAQARESPLERVDRAADASTLAQIAAGPPTIGVPTACGYLGISKSAGYELIKTGGFPCRVLRMGNRSRVLTASLIAVLRDGIVD
jgi:predicted DNA-binding transcriptional regulator AlpA